MNSTTSTQYGSIEVPTTTISNVAAQESTSATTISKTNEIYLVTKKEYESLKFSCKLNLVGGGLMTGLGFASVIYTALTSEYYETRQIMSMLFLNIAMGSMYLGKGI